METLNNELIRQGQKNGPTYCDEEGNLAQDPQCQEMFVHFWMDIKQERPGIIAEDVNVGEEYGIGG